METEFVVYILYSPSSQRFYVGYTSNLIQRLISHNMSKKGFTNRFRPWSVVYVKFMGSKSEAMIHEKFLKSGKGRDFWKNNFDPEKGYITNEVIPLI